MRHLVPLLVLALGCRSGGKVGTDATGEDDGDSGLTEGGTGGTGGADAGSDGSDGSDGADGSDGSGGTNGTDGGSTDGSDGSDGGGGTDGSDGGGGTDGSDGTGGTEVCNGVDDDGDGLIDEDGVCPETVFNDTSTGHAYLASATLRSWQDSVDYCATLGYHMVTISDATENELVWTIIYGPTEADDGEIEGHTWMGYHDSGSGFSWIDGTAAGFENFNGEVLTDDWGTANFGQAAAFCDHLTPEWHEVPGTWRYGVVCETEG